MIFIDLPSLILYSEGPVGKGKTNYFLMLGPINLILVVNIRGQVH
jgi:hypothetical protein